MAHNLRVPAHFGIRTERYKLIFFYGCTPAGGQRTPVAWEFYDLQEDPLEMHNDYTSPDYVDVIAGLKQQLWKMRTALNETDHKFPPVHQIVDLYRKAER